MKPQYSGQKIRRFATLLAGLGVVGLNQIEIPRYHNLHLREKLLPFGLLFGGGGLIIREAELIPTH